jgi:Asp-tRNA(Asn)/Glu-tRNA(Gln) amidotransferase A subunit family amidase
MLRMFSEASPLQQTLAALAAGQTTPRSLAEQALRQANSNLGRNVYISMDPEWTLREADALTARYRNAVKPPLYGLPVSVKDCFDLAGFPTSCGSRYYARKNGLAREDSALAARLREQGAVIIGKTHLHQLAYGITGENPDYGDSVQPRNVKVLTGGSSSGAVASLQEGSALAAIGTDTGGSIRVPAALCGLAGYRASFELAYDGNLWRGGVHLAPSFDTIGWLFRDLRDAPLLADALFGLRSRITTPKVRVRIGCAAREFLHDSNAAVLRGWEEWRAALTERGAEIVPIDSAFWEDAMDIYAPIQAHEAAAYHALQTGNDFSHFAPAIAERLTWGQSLGESEIAGFRGLLAAFRERIDKLLSEHDYLIAPCAPMNELPAGADHTATRRSILRYATPLSLPGVPVVALPAPAGAGVQLIAARGADERLLAYAATLAPIV